jgi:hypothetical protein
VTHIETERKFVEFVAAKLELAIDKEIFRGTVPENRPEGVGVMLSGLSDPMAFETVYQGQILAKFYDRDKALAFQEKLTSLFPHYGARPFTCVTPRGAGEPYCSSERGRSAWFVSFNVDIVVC